MESFIIDRTELDEDPRLEKSKFLLSPEEADRSVDPETQARLEALLHAAGNGLYCFTNLYFDTTPLPIYVFTLVTFSHIIK